MTLALLAIAFFGAACGQSVHQETTTEAQTECKTGQAAIGVFDGFYKNLCGCAESTGQTITPPTALTCTIPQGTVVFIHYLSPSLPAQIVPVGTPSFIPSEAYDPEDRSTRSVARTFDTVGTYQFMNSYNQPMTGQFIVQ
jgi:hypothetical protein